MTTHHEPAPEHVQAAARIADDAVAAAGGPDAVLANLDDLKIDSAQSALAAQARLEPLAEFDGGYPEDVPEPVRNAWRARRGLQAVHLYADRDGNAEGEPVEQYLRDLLSDLMHLCDLFENSPTVPTDFDSLVEQARFVHDDEVDRP